MRAARASRSQTRLVAVLLLTHHDGHGGVRGREQMIVDGASATVRGRSGRGIVGGLERHVAVGAPGLRLGRIVETVHAVTGDPAHQEAVVVVLAAQPAVMVQGLRQVHLVAGGAELRGLVQGFQQALLVQFGLGADELSVQGLEERVLAAVEGVGWRVGESIVGVAAGTADGVDRVAGHAGDAGPAARVRVRVVGGVVEAPGVERHRVVAARAQPGRGDIAVPRQEHPTGLVDARPIGRIVE